jgi:hypothetical protein
MTNDKSEMTNGKCFFPRTYFIHDLLSHVPDDRQFEHLALIRFDGSEYESDQNTARLAKRLARLPRPAG